MSVKVKQKISSSVSYGDTGITVDQGSTDVDVAYTIEKIDGFNGRIATGVFTMDIGGQISNERFRFMFPTSGDSVSLQDAEQALDKFFKEQGEASKQAGKSS